jgi:probable phosphoglycerate mutase
LLAESDNGGTVADVAHGGPLYLVIGAVAGRDVVSAVVDGEQHNCGLNELRVSDGTASVVTENRTDFLDGASA